MNEIKITDCFLLSKEEYKKYKMKFYLCYSNAKQRQRSKKMRLDLLIAFWFMFILIIGAAALLNLIIMQLKKRLPKIKKNIAIAMCWIFYPDEYKNYRKDLKK